MGDNMAQTAKEYLTPDFTDRLQETVNEDSQFNEQARWFDGSILVEIGTEQLWLKCYKGEVIDTMDQIPPIGYTFKITGSKDSWTEYLTGQRRFGDLINFGEEVRAEIWMEGDLMAANRVREATYLLAEHMQGSHNQ
jgi:hypothetical protein